MAGFSKVQSYAIKSAVIALAFADVATYFVINRQIHEPVVTSEEVVDLTYKVDPVRPTLAVLAAADSSLTAPAIAPNEITSQMSELPLPTADSKLAMQLPLVEEDLLDAPGRAKPVTNESQARRNNVPTLPAAPRRTETRAFSRAFSSYPVAKERELASAYDDVAAEAASLNCPPAQPDLADDNGAPMESAARQDFGQVPSGQSPELPALIGWPTNPDADDKSIAAPVPQVWDSGGAAERISPTPAVTPPLYGPESQAVPAAVTPPIALDVQTNELVQVTDAVATELISRSPRAAAAATMAKSVSRSEIPSVLASGSRQPLARSGREIQQVAHDLQVAAGPARDAIVVPLQEGRAQPIARISPATADGIWSGRSEQLEREPASLSPAHEPIALSLRDILIAFRPLMSSGEFEWLMRSKHSAAKVSLTTLAEAGIAFEYDPASNKVKFSKGPG